MSIYGIKGWDWFINRDLGHKNTDLDITELQNFIKVLLTL